MKHYRIALLLFSVLLSNCLILGTVAYANVYDVCTSTDSTGSSEYQDEKLYFPCDSSGDIVGDDLSAISFSGGYTNTWSQMENQSIAFAEAGIVVLTVTPHSYFGWPWASVYTWTRAHRGALDKLKELNNSSSHFLYDKIDTTSLGEVGFSKGGGGVLKSVNSNPEDGVKTIIAMCPWLRSGEHDDIDNIDIPVFIFTGTDDLIAPGSRVRDIRDALVSNPSHDDVLYVNYYDIDHFNMYGSSNTIMERTIEAMVAWLKVYLDNDYSYLTYIDGAIQEDNDDDGWYYDYIWY